MPAAPVPPPRWGIVTTLKGPLRDMQRFAAYHLALGAARIEIYLDAPRENTLRALTTDPRLHVTACDSSYWRDSTIGRRPKQHQLRQAHNATRSYARAHCPLDGTDGVNGAASAPLDWIAHIDMDEFILERGNGADDTARPDVEALLAPLPDTVTALVMRPAEMLAPEGGGTAPAKGIGGLSGPRHFKLKPVSAGQDKSVLEDLYPNFGAHLRGGFISHLGGKIFARTGITNARLGIHMLFEDGVPTLGRLSSNDLFIGHAHAPSWPVFERHIAFRMTHGSYRKRNSKNFRLADIIDVLTQDHDPENDPDHPMRGFFREVCEARTDLIAALRRHDMLLTRDLHLDALRRDTFPDPANRPSDKARTDA
ncbi:hypothetical protein A9Q95_03125 [Rhodobacterales bacterium 59_46_T64]|nr:hypothetical protein A9Q95_03125 [Rhodobacterales bacterium 59_46_T64]